MRFAFLSHHRSVSKFGYWRPWLVRYSCANAISLCLLKASYLQANQHILPYKLDLDEAGVLPERILMAPFVAVMLVLFVAIRLSATQRTFR